MSTANAPAAPFHAHLVQSSSSSGMHKPKLSQQVLSMSSDTIMSCRLYKQGPGHDNQLLSRLDVLVVLHSVSNNKNTKTRCHCGPEQGHKDVDDDENDESKSYASARRQGRTHTAREASLSLVPW